MKVYDATESLVHLGCCLLDSCELERACRQLCYDVEKQNVDASPVFAVCLYWTDFVQAVLEVEARACPQPLAHL